MPNTKSRIPNSLLILFSYAERIGETAIHLTYQARRAYSERDFSRVAERSQSLLNLPPFCEVGEYYQGLALSQHGTGDIEASQKTFQRLAESPIIQLRAASTLTLGMHQFRRKNYTEAERLILKANSLALSENTCAPVTAINAHNILAIMRGVEGDSVESIKLLKRVEPLVKEIAHLYPALLGQHLNSLAYELLQLGEMEAALHHIDKALAIRQVTPLSEWIETRQEITEAARPSHSPQVFVPDNNPAPDPQDHPLPDNVSRGDFNRQRNREDLSEKIGGKLLLYPGWAPTWLEVYLHLEDKMHLYETCAIPIDRQNAAQMVRKVLETVDEISSVNRGDGEIEMEVYFCTRQISISIGEDVSYWVRPECLGNLTNLFDELSQQKTSQVFGVRGDIR